MINIEIIESDIINWEQYYYKTLKVRQKFSNLEFPEKPKDDLLYKLLIMAQGINQNETYNSWDFPKWRWVDDLDRVIPYHVRSTNKAYAIWVLDSLEPDLETIGKSTYQLDPGSVKDDFRNLSGAIGITNLERMILGSKYFQETGQELDIKGTTLCSGSRCIDGSVPSMLKSRSLGNVRMIYHPVNYLNADFNGGIRKAFL